MNLLIALIPALCWGLNPTIVGKIGGKPIQQQLGTALGATLFAIVIYVIMHPALTPSLIIGCVISGAFWSVGQLLQYKSYGVLGTGKAFAISTGLNLVLNSLFGVCVMGDWAKANQKIIGFAALAVIICGTVLTSYSDNKEECDLKKGVIILLIAAVGFTGYSCAPAFVGAGGIQAVFPQAIGMIGGSLILSLFESKDIKKFDTVTFKNMIPGLVWACANIAMIYANKLNGVAIGFTLSQMAVVVSTFATLVILKEKKSHKEFVHTILGTVVVAIGGVMIGFTK